MDNKFNVSIVDDKVIIELDFKELLRIKEENNNCKSCNNEEKNECCNNKEENINKELDELISLIRNEISK